MRALIDIAAQQVISVFSGAVPARADGQAIVALVDDPETYDPATHNRVLDRYEFAGAKVIRHWTLTAKTQQEIYDAHLAEGYLDAATGIKLKTTEYAQTKFTQQFTLLSAGLAAGAVQPEADQTIWGYDEQPHSIPTSALLALLLRYGAHCAQLSHDYAP